MIRADLADARAMWLQETSHDPDEFARRTDGDFLLVKNHDGEMFDFHSLRHTCGVWLALAGVHPKVVQTVMRHSTITLTMDTYGHLFPGQEFDAIDRLGNVFGDGPAALQATGTDDGTAETAQRMAQQSGRETVPRDATTRDGEFSTEASGPAPNLLRIAEFCGDSLRLVQQLSVRSCATYRADRIGASHNSGGDEPRELQLVLDPEFL